MSLVKDLASKRTPPKPTAQKGSLGSRIYRLPSINCKVVSPEGQVLISRDGLVEVDIELQPELYEEMEQMLAIGNCSLYSSDAPLTAAQALPE